MSELVLVRHGETEWSASGQHTGVSDIPLTPAGEHQVSELRPLLDGRSFGLVLTSPLLRAKRTAELLGWIRISLSGTTAVTRGGRRRTSVPNWGGPGGSGRIRCRPGQPRARRSARSRSGRTGSWLGLRLF